MPESQSMVGLGPGATTTAPEGSVTVAIRLLRWGKDEGATALLWQRYFDRLDRLAARIIRLGRRATLGDEQDAAQEALTAFCLGVAKGYWPDLQDREGVWRLLAGITENKAFQQLRGPRFEPLPDGDDGLVVVRPSLEYQAHVQLTLGQLLDEIDNPDHRRALELYLEGYTLREIAPQVGRTAACVGLWFKKVVLEWERRHGEPPIP